MIGDTVTAYLGREDLWAALCAMDCLEYGGEVSAEHARAALDAVWEFVSDQCEEYSDRVPTKEESLAELLKLIEARTGS